MFVDFPPDTPAHAPVLMVAEAAQAQRPVSVQRTLGVCRPMENIPNDPVLESMTISFAAAAANYLYDYEKRNVSDRGAKITMLQTPIHGRLIGDNSTYIPDIGFHGQEKIAALVELGGYQVKVVYFIKVVNEGQRVGDDEASIKKYCPRTDWKISSTLDVNGNSTLTAVDYLPSLTDDSTPIMDAASLVSTLDSGFLSRISGETSSITLNIADLAGGAIGQTTGTTITLDTNAAGHGWFIDSTPADNSEFLPTSNPSEWVAKAGSEAFGKMDLLTVLLHEYGHALGLEHSTYAHDFMATTLQPGVRRTLTVDEQLALMQLAGFFPTPDSPSAPYGPTDPGAPLPFTRVLSNARNARLRREGALDNSLQNSLDALVPQFDTAANPKLTNPEFAGAQGWATTGDVAFTNGAATLTETASTQTRLNQVFVLGENDRFLSFTLANTALGDQANGPDDAFEVALIDASTGLSLLGGTGLTHNDAIVNRQADGSEYKATGINVVNNADGSRTYLVDLAGIPAGTVVNLAFDLIGFGSGAAATNSHLTIRDLRLGVPQTTDDAATFAEDSPAIIDALANDLNARQPGFVPVVVSGPAHGQVAIDAEGRFTYTPEANWNGTDSFTYKISDRK